MKTLILGASPNPSRYSHRATLALAGDDHEVVPVGIRKGEIGRHSIITDKEIHKDIDTITLYVGPQNQSVWEDYIINTEPRRVIFNPGTENLELKRKLDEKGIITEYACTLVMLATRQY